jgi:hypothetical protein
MSTIAVFGVLGGGAYAAGTIGAKDIKRNAVRAKHVKKSQIASRHLKRNAVTRAKIAAGAVGASKLANGAVTNAKIADGSVTGAKVDESSLGPVPNADRLDGLSSLDFIRGAGRVHGGRIVDAPSGPSTEIPLDVGGSLALQCNNPASAGTSFTFANTSGAPADVWTERMQGAALPAPYTVAYSSVPSGDDQSISVSGPAVGSGESVVNFTIAIGARVTVIEAKLVFAGQQCHAATLISELRG